MAMIQPRVSVHLVLRGEWKVLLARRFLTGNEDGKYGLIFHEMEAGETLTETLSREAREAIGVILEQKDLRLVHVMHREVENCLDFFFLARHWSGDPMNLDPEKYDDLAWYELGTLPENTVPYVKIALTYARDDIRYSEFRKKEDALAPAVGILQNPDDEDV